MYTIRFYNAGEGIDLTLSRLQTQAITDTDVDLGAIARSINGTLLDHTDGYKKEYDIQARFLDKEALDVIKDIMRRHVQVQFTWTDEYTNQQIDQYDALLRPAGYALQGQNRIATGTIKVLEI